MKKGTADKKPCDNARTHRLSPEKRVRQLTCLYGVARLATQPGISIEQLLSEMVELLPEACLYPDSACARIVLGDKEYNTANYRESKRCLRTELVVGGNSVGYVEVGHFHDEPLSEEEHLLMETVACEISMLVEQKQAEVRQSQLEVQLRQADRLATIGQLGAELAHDLNEPLSNVLGFAQLAVKDRSLKAQTRADIENIVTASLHARKIIAKFLSFAGQTATEKERINLNSVVTDGLSLIQPRCTQAGIEVIREVAENLPEIEADRTQMLQVLTNLAVNAIQAMPGGGKLTISTGRNGNHVELAVKDTGTGMSKETMEQIFSPFFTTKSIDEGTGLGLSVVRSIVTSHGGTIEVQSALNKGSQFTVRLPLHKITAETRGDSRD